MRISHLIASLTAATVLVLTLGKAAHAELLIEVDKSAQRMTVTLNGAQLYYWPVSTGGRGYDTPSGTFKPFRMEIDHYSEEWDDAPMPYSIFFIRSATLSTAPTRSAISAIRSRTAACGCRRRMQPRCGRW